MKKCNYEKIEIILWSQTYRYTYCKIFNGFTYLLVMLIIIFNRICELFINIFILFGFFNSLEYVF